MNQLGDSHRPSWLDRPYNFIQLEWDSTLSLLRMKTQVRPIQCYSLGLMAEMHQVFTDISTSSGYVKHLVMTSDIQGVFNFGGDLSLFVLLIRARDLESLQMYGHRCIELIWWMETASQRGIHTVVLYRATHWVAVLSRFYPIIKSSSSAVPKAVIQKSFLTYSQEWVPGILPFARRVSRWLMR